MCLVREEGISIWILTDILLGFVTFPKTVVRLNRLIFSKMMFRYKENVSDFLTHTQNSGNFLPSRHVWQKAFIWSDGSPSKFFFFSLFENKSIKNFCQLHATRALMFILTFYFPFFEDIKKKEKMLVKLWLWCK